MATREREISKTGWMQARKSQPLHGKKVGSWKSSKKCEYEPEKWTALCIHDQKIPLLEFYERETEVPAHTPIEVLDLLDVNFVSIDIQNPRALSIGFKSGERSALELVALTTIERDEWVSMLNVQLEMIGCLDKNDNIYSDLPELIASSSNPNNVHQMPNANVLVDLRSQPASGAGEVDGSIRNDASASIIEREPSRASHVSTTSNTSSTTAIELRDALRPIDELYETIAPVLSHHAPATRNINDNNNETVSVVSDEELTAQMVSGRRGDSSNQQQPIVSVDGELPPSSPIRTSSGYTLIEPKSTARSSGQSSPTVHRRAEQHDQQDGDQHRTQNDRNRGPEATISKDTVAVAVHPGKSPQSMDQIDDGKGKKDIPPPMPPRHPPFDKNDDISSTVYEFPSSSSVVYDPLFNNGPLHHSIPVLIDTSRQQNEEEDVYDSPKSPFDQAFDLFEGSNTAEESRQQYDTLYDTNQPPSVSPQPPVYDTPVGFIVQERSNLDVETPRISAAAAGPWDAGTSDVPFGNSAISGMIDPFANNNNDNNDANGGEFHAAAAPESSQPLRKDDSFGIPDGAFGSPPTGTATSTIASFGRFSDAFDNFTSSNGDYQQIPANNNENPRPVSGSSGNKNLAPNRPRLAPKPSSPGQQSVDSCDISSAQTSPRIDSLDENLENERRRLSYGKNKNNNNDKNDEAEGKSNEGFQENEYETRYMEPPTVVRPVPPELIARESINRSQPGGRSPSFGFATLSLSSSFGAPGEEDEPPNLPPRSPLSPLSVASSYDTATISRYDFSTTASTSRSGMHSSADRTLLEGEMEKVENEMKLERLITVAISSTDAIHDLAIVEIRGKLWIAGWTKSSHRSMARSFHVGDQLVSLNRNMELASLRQVDILLRNSANKTVELGIRRLPYGRIYLLTRTSGNNEHVGISTDKGKNTIKMVEAGSVAYNAGVEGVVNSAKKANQQVPAVITEINNRPVKGEAERKLGALGKQMTIVTHPKDFVKDLKSALEASKKNWKDYALSH